MKSKGFSLIELVIVVAIGLVTAAMAIPRFNTTLNNYRINGAARQVQALATLAHVKAAARNTRYRVQRNTTTTFRLQFCNDPLATRTNPCLSWLMDSTSATITMPPGVVFSVTGIATVPAVVTAPVPAACPALPAPCPTQTVMTFNSRGLLFDEGTNVPSDYSCFYIRGRGTRPMAVCTVLTGRAIVYVLEANGAWTQL